jgi:glycosyltransferase involved in cell wall biosynthesis
MMKSIEPDGPIEKPIVSVIMIFYNAENFLREAIESIFSQTYQGWELLLVDDGSIDRSRFIAQKYLKQHPGRVRYLEHPDYQNHGKPASRNLGIQNASGDYLAFLDADDVWLPQKLEQQVAILEAYPEAAMVYGLSKWWYSWTGRLEDRELDFLHPLGVQPDTLIKPPQLLFPFFFRQESAIPNPSNILIRKKVVAEIDGFEESFNGLYNVYEDQAFLAKLCLKSPVIATNACWDLYRQHPNSSCAVVENIGQEYEARQFFFRWLAAYLAGQGIEDPALWRELRKEIRRISHPDSQRLLQKTKQKTQQARNLLFHVAQKLMPAPVYCWVSSRLRGQEYHPPVGWVRFGNLRRTTPLSQMFGYDRASPIDRYYIENFLAAHQSDIRGHVLEIAEDNYTRRFGGDRVTKSDVLHLDPDTPKTTLVGDLTTADHIPSDTFDCILLTQTLQFIYDVPSALKTVFRILKPSGVVLVTIPGISPISRYDMERWGQYWSFTTQSARRLSEEVFPPDCVEIQAFGNILVASAFLFGMAAQELEKEELDHRDPDFELIITIRAVKPE